MGEEKIVLKKFARKKVHKIHPRKTKCTKKLRKNSAQNSWAKEKQCTKKFARRKVH